MVFPQIRIMPLFLAIVVLAFGLRLVDVVTGVTMLSGTARAESKAEEKTEEKTEEKKPEEEVKPEEKSEEHAKEESTGEKKEEPTAEKEGEHKDGEAKAAEGEAEKGKEEGEKDSETTEWHDAADSDIDYTSVRMELFQDLAKRRDELDKRDKELATRQAMLEAAEKEIDRKYQELSLLRKEIERLLQQQSEEEKNRTQSLVKIYESMKPKDAARIFNTLDLDILLSVMGSMSERRLSAIMAQMSPERARTLTIMLAEQKKLPEFSESN